MIRSGCGGEEEELEDRSERRAVLHCGETSKEDTTPVKEDVRVVGGGDADEVSSEGGVVEGGDELKEGGIWRDEREWMGGRKWVVAFRISIARGGAEVVIDGGSLERPVDGELSFQRENRAGCVLNESLKF